MRKEPLENWLQSYSSEFPKGDIVNDDLLRKEKYVDLFSYS